MTIYNPCTLFIESFHGYYQFVHLPFCYDGNYVQTTFKLLDNKRNVMLLKTSKLTFFDQMS